MTKRLQVVLDDAELEEIERVAGQKGMTVAEWVRQALFEARRVGSTSLVERKLLAVRAAVAHSYPTGDVGQINAEIERGHTASPR